MDLEKDIKRLGECLRRLDPHAWDSVKRHRLIMREAGLPRLEIQLRIKADLFRLLDELNQTESIHGSLSGRALEA